MGLHAQAFAAMPLPPALAEVMNDLLDEEHTGSADFLFFDRYAATQPDDPETECDARLQQEGNS